MLNYNNVILPVILYMYMLAVIVDRTSMTLCDLFHAELWLQWIGDELPLCSIPEAAMEMGQLFETAVKDYLCEHIIRLHLNFYYTVYCKDSGICWD